MESATKGNNMTAYYNAYYNSIKMTNRNKKLSY